MNISIEQVETAISSLHVMTAFLDTEFNFIRVNPAYAAATGKVPQDFAGKNHFVLYPDAENEAIFRRVLETREPYSVRAKPFEHPDQPERGTTYWDWRLQPLLSGGELLGLVLILIDVTEHVRRSDELKHAYELIASSEAHYRSLFNSVSDAIFVLVPGAELVSDRVIEVNEVACHRLGYTREELIGLTPAQFNLSGHPENPEAIRQNLMQQGNVLFETVHLARDGRHIPTEVGVHLLQVKGERLMYAVARDITERKTAESQHRQSERFIRALLNATSESSFLLDRNGVVLALNETAVRRLQRPEREILGKSAFDLIPPELAASRRARFLEAVDSRKPVAIEDERAGMRFLSTYTPILDEAGAVVQVALYATDVTERRQLEAIEQLLPAVNHKILEGAPLQEVLDMICEKTVEAFGLALVWAGRKMEDGSVSVLAASGSAQGYLDDLRQVGVRWDDSPLARGPTGSAIRMGEVQYRRTDDVRFSPWAHAAAKQGMKSVIAVPLIQRGSIYGAFTLYSLQAAQFESPTFLKRITALADKIRLALEMATEQEKISLLSTALVSASNAVMITNPAGRIEWVNPAFVMLSGYSSAELIGCNPNILKSGKQDAAYYQKLWQTILSGQVWSRDTTERRKDGTLYTVQQTITPILSENGEITHFVAIHEDVTTKLDTQARIQYIASHDGLTGLPNRALFFDRMGQLFSLSRRNQGSLALMFIDLDGFKLVNDKLGHHAGDLLLKGVAERLLACVRGSDTVARMGGDEFTVILFDIPDKENVARIAEKILDELSRPFELEGQYAQIGASIGIATAGAEPQISENQFIESADTAMYEAKRAGKNCYRFSQDAAQ